MRFQLAMDNYVGNIFFPFNDSVIAPTIAEKGVWEPIEVDWLVGNLKRGDYFLNIGANVGYFSLIASKIVGRKGVVYAVEPNPEVIPFLRVNSVRSKYANIKIIEAAASDRNSEVTLYQNFNNFGDSRLFDPRKSDAGGSFLEHGFDQVPINVQVTSIALDELKLPRLDLILSDTQGWDYFALLGLEKTIQRYRPKISLEFVPDWLLQNGINPENAINQFLKWGYRVSVLSEQTIQIENFAEIERLMSQKNDYFVTLILN